MRKNNRERILDAAIRVIDRDGTAGVTYQSVAAEADLTAGGLVYHFATREAMMLAIQEYAAAQWEQRLKDSLGRDLEDASPGDRLRAYIDVTVAGSARPELLLILEPASDQTQNEPWKETMAPWMPDPSHPEAPDDALDQLIARLAADGLWLYEAIGNATLPPDLRERFVQRLAALAGAPSPDAPNATS